MSSTPGNTPQNPFTPSVLNQMLKKHLNQQFGSFWLSGEIFECYRSPAGHNYFTLKDQQAGIKCVLFKQNHQGPLHKGTQVTVLGQLSMYTPKGDLQVNVVKLMTTGQGDLEQQFLLLKQKLSQAGLFESSRKKPIPQIINSIGIITSPKGAALQDILNVFLRHNPLIEVTVYPTLVQGQDAPPQINHALRTADEQQHDVLLLTRGGGSKEDLWAFNDEFLAHQLAQLNTPVISAVGHETDESISDLVADHSCITPTAAAQYISGDFKQLQQSLEHKSRLLSLLIKDKYRIFQQQLDASTHQLEKQHPKATLKNQQLSLQNLSCSLRSATLNLHNKHLNRHQQLQQRLYDKCPDTSRQQQAINNSNEHLNWHLQRSLNTAKQQLLIQVNELNNQNPLAVLARGYSLTQKLDDHSVVSNVSQVEIGDKVETQLKSGRIHAKIFERFEN